MIIAEGFNTCGAGIGRTGTFCTVDIALRRLQALESTNVTLTAAKQAVDIKQIVQKLRRQRQGMVQTKSQYIFCHEVRSGPKRQAYIFSDCKNTCLETVQ